MIIDNVKRLAKEKGYTIKKLEEDAGLSNGTIGKWDKNRPLYQSLKKVAAVLDVPIEELDKE